MAKRDSNILAEVEGKPVHVTFQGGLMAASRGKTRLELEATRVVETTKLFISSREAQMLISKIQAVEFATRGNPVLLALGFMTLPLFGLGLIFFLMYLLGFKKRFLIIKAPAHLMAVVVKGDSEPYLDFMDRLLYQMERVNRTAASDGANGEGGISIPTPPARAQVGGGSPAALRAPAGNTIRCENCDTELRLPPNSGGKKFRCTNCKGIIEVPVGM